MKHENQRFLWAVSILSFLGHGVLVGRSDGAPAILSMDAAAASNPEVDALVRRYQSSIDRYVFLAGGASNMSDARRAQLTRLFEGALPRLADRGRLAVGDGGTQAGIMQAAGTARQRSGGAFQLVGITPAPEIAPGAAQRVDPNHSHVIAVRNEPWLAAQRANGWQRDWGHFGSETESMYRTFDRMSRGRPSVAIVANGGGITFDEVRQNVAQGRHMVLIEGSGRVTDAISQEVLGRRVAVDPDPAVRAEFQRLVTRVQQANLPADRFSVVPLEAGSRALANHVEGILQSQDAGRSRLVSSVRSNLSAGNLLTAPLLTGASSLAGSIARGDSFAEGFRDAGRQLGSAEFLLGTMGAGTAGSILGAALNPVSRGAFATVGGRAGAFLRGASRSFAPLAGAFLAAELATNAIRLHRQGDLTMRSLLGSLDWLGLGASFAGTLAGSSLAVALIGATGPLGLVVIAGGLLGGMAAQYLLDQWRRRAPREAAPRADSRAVGAISLLQVAGAH